MLPLVIVVTAFIVLRTAGSLGIRPLTSWLTCLRWALAVMFLVTASGHWGSRRADLVAMVPPLFPSPGLLVTLTGILEIAGAVGLMIPRTSRTAALCLAVMLVAMFPANVYAARQGLSIRGRPATALPLRTAVQIGLVAATAAIALTAQPAASGRRRRLVPFARTAAE